jgi:hypothetical protein
MILHIFQIGDGETSEEVAMDMRRWLKITLALEKQT